MERENIIQQKSYDFAVRIIKAYKYMIENKSEYVLSKQLVRSGTSIGANVEEAIGGQSTKDFYAKMTISYKEARECRFWIRLMTDTDYLTKEQGQSLINDLEEVLKIITAIQKTTKGNMNK
ncbi:MAG TPA: four helix bundle protein [Saprospiraceae bacterium]|nr:four helix bundle protein [Saprospiraceae bacterium]